MKILHLETSSKNCSVAISDGKELLCLCEELSDNYKQSESLHTFVEWALEGANITLRNLDAVSLGMGPGSYTGLRIGASAAKGFCFGLQIPLIAVNSLETMIKPFLGTDYDLIIPMVDARRLEVYTAIYDGQSGKQEQPTSSLVLDEFTLNNLSDKKILIVGDGAAKAKDILNLPNAEFNDSVYPSAQYLTDESVRKFNAGEFEDVAYFEPLYLKDFQGVKRKGVN